MAIIKRTSFAVLLAALLAPVSAQTSVQFDRCFYDEDERIAGSTNPGNNRDGSQRRTYGNLCRGTQTEADSGTNDNDIDARIGHPFRRLCDIIDLNPNVQALMASGNSPHTIFAPTDAAFSKVEGLINRVNTQRLLELHILPQARLSRDLRCGQTYRTINTNQSRRDNQRSKTRCISAARSQQLGPGNVVNGLKPTIGVPEDIFRVEEFESQNGFVISVNQQESDDSSDRETFSQDVISCNGVIHVVDEVLLPGNVNAFRTHGVATHGVPTYQGSHAHAHPTIADIGSLGYYGGYNGGYNGGRYGPSYYGGRYGTGYGNHFHGRGHKGGKGGKGGKGFKGSRRRGHNYYGYGYGGMEPGFFRKLGEQEESISDAEFFGTNGLVENESAVSDEDRKRRLEALLEPDGNIAQV